MKKALAVTAVILGAVALAAWTGFFLSLPTGKSGPFTVRAGESSESIIRRLKDEGLIRSRLFFTFALRDSGLAQKLQPGTYDFRGDATYEEMIRRLTTGGIAANEFTLRIIEGWDLNDIHAALEKAGYAQADGLFGVTGLPATDHRSLSSDRAPKPDDLSREFPFLADKPSYVSLEGYLFPDTYRIFRDATPEELVRVLVSNFDRKLSPELRRKIEASGRSIYDIVTMASVVEREVRGEKDRRMVADIFWRRFERGMALQADSTVNYATGKSLAAVTFEDTKNVSRYNTYKYPGLPLGPICNPGLAAITATIEPEPNPYWFFLTDKEGNVHYGRTLDEHNANKARYLK